MNSLFGLTIPDQGFWVICALFYFADCFRNVPEKQLILSQNIRGEWLPLFPYYDFRVCGRALTLLNPINPCLAAIRIGWLLPEPNAPRLLRRTETVVRIYLSRLKKYQVLSALCFLVYFVIGPVVTYYVGLSYALVLIFPLHLSLLFFLLGCMVVERRFWRMH